MSKKAVIFDLDGTLTDTLKSIWKSANLALSDVGLPHIDGPLLGFIGINRQKKPFFF